MTATINFTIRQGKTFTKLITWKPSGVLANLTGYTAKMMGSNVWTMSGNLGLSNSAIMLVSGGSVTLGGILDRLRITTVNGTDTFDAGSINILYEI